MPVAAYVKLWIYNILSSFCLDSLATRFLEWEWTWFGERQVVDGEYSYSYWCIATTDDRLDQIDETLARFHAEGDESLR